MLDFRTAVLGMQFCEIPCRECRRWRVRCARLGLRKIEISCGRFSLSENLPSLQFLGGSHYHWFKSLSILFFLHALFIRSVTGGFLKYLKIFFDLGSHYDCFQRTFCMDVLMPSAIGT